VLGRARNEQAMAFSPAWPVRLRQEARLPIRRSHRAHPGGDVTARCGSLRSFTSTTADWGRCGNPTALISPVVPHAALPFVAAGHQHGGPWANKDLITRGGDDGTRTHDPCLKMSPRRTAAKVRDHVRPDQRTTGTSANASERLWTVHEMVYFRPAVRHSPGVYVAQPPIHAACGLTNNFLGIDV
jgi:hypothetical protein